MPFKKNIHILLIVFSLLSIFASVEDNLIYIKQVHYKQHHVVICKINTLLAIILYKIFKNFISVQALLSGRKHRELSDEFEVLQLN
jgi:hypothetical protein